MFLISICLPTRESSIVAEVFHGPTSQCLYLTHQYGTLCERLLAATGIKKGPKIFAITNIPSSDLAQSCIQIRLLSVGVCGIHISASRGRVCIVLVAHKSEDLMQRHHFAFHQPRQSTVETKAFQLALRKSLSEQTKQSVKVERTLEKYTKMFCFSVRTKILINVRRDYLFSMMQSVRH